MLKIIRKLLSFLELSYHEEFVPTLASVNYRTTVLKSRKKQKNSDYLVKYENFPNSNPTWINSELLNK